MGSGREFLAELPLLKIENGLLSKRDIFREEVVEIIIHSRIVSASTKTDYSEEN
jgi:hypothetical protein